MRPDINAIEERRKRLYKSDADNVYVEDYLADTEFLLNRINDLTTQLAEAKADYDKAVEDMGMMHIAGENCVYCKNHSNCPMEHMQIGRCRQFEYRGRKSNGR